MDNQILLANRNAESLRLEFSLTNFLRPASQVGATRIYASGYPKIARGNWLGRPHRRAVDESGRRKAQCLEPFSELDRYQSQLSYSITSDQRSAPKGRATRRFVGALPAGCPG